MWQGLDAFDVSHKESPLAGADRSDEALPGGKLNDVRDAAVVVRADLIGVPQHRFKLFGETRLVDGAVDDHAHCVGVISNLAFAGVGGAFDGDGVGGHLRCVWWGLPLTP